jgi:hypothetical protein
LKKYGTSIVSVKSQDTPISVRGWVGVATTGLGFANGGWTWYSLIQNGPDWTDYNTLYDQFRILSINMSYEPYNRYQTNFVGEGVVYYDTDSTSAASGGALAITSAVAYSSARHVNYMAPWKLCYKYAPFCKDAYFNPAVGVNASNQGAIFFTAGYSGPLSTTLGGIMYEIRMLGRGKF